MTESEALEKFELLYQEHMIEGGNDTEYMHIEIDKLLCQVLNDLGYKKLVDKYNSIEVSYN